MLSEWQYVFEVQRELLEFQILCDSIHLFQEEIVWLLRCHFSDVKTTDRMVRYGSTAMIRMLIFSMETVQKVTKLPMHFLDRWEVNLSSTETPDEKKSAFEIVSKKLLKRLQMGPIDY